MTEENKRSNECTKHQGKKTSKADHGKSMKDVEKKDIETYLSILPFINNEVVQGWQQKINGNKNTIQIVISQQQLQKLASLKATCTSSVIMVHC
jgi:hypothetical protein